MMKTYKIAVIAGDGIGPEVISQGVKFLNAAAKMDDTFRFLFTEFPWGCNYYLKNGEMLPEYGIETLSSFDAIYLGAIGDPRVPDHISLNGLLLKIRKSFDQYVNLRPVKLIEGAPCPLKNGNPDEIDMIFVRENTEGEYAGTGRFENEGTDEETAVQESVFTYKGCQRVIRYAFELARKEHKSCTSISKGNALNYSMVFWDKMFHEVSKEYPDVTTHHYLVDAASMYMVTDPGRFDVVVTSNLFGDILTDLGAAITGGMGMAAGANLNPEKKYPSMFEPIHGSAPDIAGKGIANPFASILAAGQMLEFLGYPEWYSRCISIIQKMLKDKKVLTPDLKGNSSTDEVGDEFVRKLLQYK